MNKHLLPLAALLISAAITLPGAHAIVLTSEISWTGMQISLDPGVAIVGHQSREHSVSIGSHRGWHENETDDPYQYMQMRISDPEGQISLDGGVLANGFRHDGVITASSPGYADHNFLASEFVSGQLAFDGDGWVHILVPYHYSVMPDPAGDHAGVTVHADITHRLSVSPGEGPTDIYEKTLFFNYDADLPAADPSGYETSGYFNLAFYTEGRSNFFYYTSTSAALRFAAPPIYTLAPVPEPETWALLGMGGMMLAVVKRRRGVRQTQEPRPS